MSDKSNTPGIIDLTTLGKTATITVSGEFGEIVGIAHYSNQNQSLLIRYKCADGRAVENWWPVDALSID